MHIITYTNDISALRAKARLHVEAYQEIRLDEDTDAVTLVMPTIGVFYNTIDSVVHSIALIVLPDPYDDNGALIGLLKTFENELEILAVGDTRNDDANCPFNKIFNDAGLSAKYDLAYPRKFVLDEEGNETSELAERQKFGVYDL